MKVAKKLELLITYFILVTLPLSDSLFSPYDSSNQKGYLNLDDEDLTDASGNNSENDNAVTTDVTSTTETTTTEGDVNENETNFTEITSTTLATTTLSTTTLAITTLATTSTVSSSTLNTITSNLNEVTTVDSSESTETTTTELSTYATSTQKPEDETQPTAEPTLQPKVQSKILEKSQQPPESKPQPPQRPSSQHPQEPRPQPPYSPQSPQRPNQPYRPDIPYVYRTGYIEPRVRPRPLSQTHSEPRPPHHRNHYQSFYPLPDVNIKVYPETQDIFEGQEVVIRCRDEGSKRLPVKWSRADGKMLPWGSTDRDGRLTMPNIVLDYNGPFKCSPLDSRYNSMSKLSYLNVLPSKRLNSISPIPLTAPCAQDQFTCYDKECVPLTYLCDGEFDCKDKSDERSCESHCGQSSFRCGDGRCIPSHQKCDNRIHCSDGSDEQNCAAPTFIISPKSLDAIESSNLTLTCKAIGVPTPVITWKHGGFHIIEDDRIKYTSSDGYGTITITNVQESDNGRWSCLATNHVDSKLSPSDALIRVTHGSPYQPQVVIDPPFYEAKRGENVRFDCKGSGNPPPKVQWTPGALSTSEFNINGTVLTLLSVSEASQGTYTCHVFNNFGHAQAQVELKVASSDAPFRLRIHPPRYDVGEGLTARFDCENLDSSDAIFEWKFKPHGASSEQELPHGVQELGSALIIRSATREHAGSYICHSDSKLGTGETLAVLTVGSEYGGSQPGRYPYPASHSYDPSQPQHHPQQQPRNQIEIYPQTQTSRVGDTARFDCRAAGIPSSNLKWIRQDGNLPEGVIVDDGLLTIPSVNDDHAGIYICEAEGPNGPIRTHARLATSQPGHPGHPSYSDYPSHPGQPHHPSYPDHPAYAGHPGRGESPDYRGHGPSLSVSIEPQRQTVVQGETGVLKCMVSGGPPGSIMWSKVNGQLTDRHKSEGDTLRIENTVIDDRGLYVCKVESEGTSFQSSAIVEIERREAPVVELFPQPVQKVPVGSSALFQCRLLSGIPSPVIKWSRENDKPMSPNTELMDGGVIRFNQLTGEEEGTYKCVAENLAGRATVDATLVIEPGSQPAYPSYPSYPSYPTHPSSPPSSGSHSSSNLPSTAIRIRQPNPYRVTVGEEAMLECMAHDEPVPMVEWKKSGSNTPLIEATETQSVYKIPQVSHSDAGEYVCVAVTPKGTSQEKIYLEVSDSPREVQRDPYSHHPNYPSRQPPYSSERGGSPDGRDLVVQPGGRADFRCALKENVEGATIEWDRENSPLPSNARVDNEVLYIDNVRPEDEGIYVCTGRMGPSVLFQDRVRLNVVDGPTVHLNPAVQVARPGDNVYIDCVAQGSSATQIEWSKEGRELPPNVIQSDGRLQFRNIQFSDSGRYLCTAHTPNGVAEGIAEVNVRDEGIDPRVVAPSRRPMGSMQNVLVNSDARMTCNFPHLPNAEISWTYDTQPLPTNSQVQNNELIVYNAQHSSAGRYICNAKVGGQIVDRDYIILNIRDSAADLEPEGTRLEGTRPEGTRPEGIRPEETRPDEGYTCEPSTHFRCNDGSCIDLRRQCDTRPDCSDRSDELNCPSTPPDVKVLIIANKDKVYLGDNLMLQCIVSSGSVTGFEWSKVSSFPDNVVTENNALNVKGVRTENEGVYTCRVATDLGQFSNDYVLTIQASLSNTEPVKTISVPFGTDATLTCDTPLEEPVQYSWYKMQPGGAYDRPITSSSEGDVVVQDKRVFLRNVDEKSTGTYECLARNAESNYKLQTILVVTGVVPKFEQFPLSYMELPKLANAETQYDIELSIKPENPNGLILYNGQSPKSGDFVFLGLRDGHVEYKYELGDGVVTIRSEEPISMDDWHKIRISKYKQEGTLDVDNQPRVTGRSPGNYDELNLQEMLYVGGVSDKNLLSSEIDIQDGFVGCISIFKINGREINLLKEATAHGIKVCDACSHNKCSIGNVCQEALTDIGYQCICSKGFYGEFCEHSEHYKPPPQFCDNITCRNGGTCISTNDNFICNCQPGFSGALCENEEPACRSQPCHNDGLCTQKDDQIMCCCKFGYRGERCEFEEKIEEEAPLQFTGSSFATLHKDIFPHDDVDFEEIIELKFKTNKTHGIIFYHGQPGTESGVHKDYIALSVENGVLQYTWDLGHGPGVIQSDFLVNDAKPHEIMLTRKGNEGSLIIDNKKPYFGESPGPVDKLDTSGDIYIGGLPDYSLMTGDKYKIGFIGCIANVVVSGIKTDMKYDSLLTCNVLACGDM